MCIFLFKCVIFDTCIFTFYPVTRVSYACLLTRVWYIFSSLTRVCWYSFLWHFHPLWVYLLTRFLCVFLPLCVYLSESLYVYFILYVYIFMYCYMYIFDVFMYVFTLYKCPYMCTFFIFLPLLFTLFECIFYVVLSLFLPTLSTLVSVFFHYFFTIFH